MDNVSSILDVINEIKAAKLTPAQKDINQITAARVNCWSKDDGYLIREVTKAEARKLVKTGAWYVISSHDIAQVE